MSTSEAEFVVINKLGLHARAAAKLVRLASSFGCEVEVGRDDQYSNAKSVMGVLLLCGSRGTTIQIRATGEGSDDAVRQIGELINDRFGEAE